MKIIFNSKIAYEAFMDKFCPSDFDLKEDKHCGNGFGIDGSHCNKCWEQSGFEYEIKGKQTDPKETVLNLNDIIKVKFTDYGRDIYFHQDDDLIEQGIPLSRSYPIVDSNGCSTIQLWRFMNIFGEHLRLGMSDQIIEDNTIYVKEESIKMADKKEATYTDLVYEIIKIECEGMDSIYEDYIVKLVGQCGLGALKRANLIESCGVLNCRQLYVLVNKK